MLICRDKLKAKVPESRLGSEEGSGAKGGSLVPHVASSSVFPNTDTELRPLGHCRSTHAHACTVAGISLGHSLGTHAHACTVAGTFILAI